MPLVTCRASLGHLGGFVYDIDFGPVVCLHQDAYQAECRMREAGVDEWAARQMLDDARFEYVHTMRVIGGQA